VIADLHLGIEYELSLKGVNIPPQTSSILERCVKIFEKYEPKKIILLGDIKHVIPLPSKRNEEYDAVVKKERNEVRKFLEELQQYGKIEIVQGNHDGSIQYLTKAMIHDSKGFTITLEGKKIGLFHGHAWPSSEVMKSDYLIMAHTHPTVMLRDKMGYAATRNCWVRANFNEKVKEKYPTAKANRQLTIMPAFNPLCGGIPVNESGIIGPMRNVIDMRNAIIYLLDGTNLGKVKDLI
jgi:hypothetical protein